MHAIGRGMRKMSFLDGLELISSTLGRGDGWVV